MAQSDGRHNRGKSLEERFWQKVNKTDGCWLWTGAKHTFGYGYIHLVRGKKRITAHRLAWIFTNGPIADGLLCCHTCDTPACVRPDHLFLGTIADNIHDCVKKKRHSRGEMKGSAILTEKEVRQIREIAPLMDRPSLYRQFPHVNPRTVRDIINNKTWTHLSLTSSNPPTATSSPSRIVDT